MNACMHRATSQLFTGLGLLVFFLMFSGAPRAQEAPPERPANQLEKVEAQESGPESAKASRGFLWSVRSETATVYLLGSMHLADESFYPLREEIMQAFRDSRVLVLEIDNARVDQSKMGLLAAELGLYRDGRTLQEALPADLYDSLLAEIASYKFDKRMLHSMKPWLAGITLARLRMQKTGLEPRYGIDAYFEKAARGKIAIEQFETAEFQLRILGGQPEAEQIELLRGMFDAEDPLASGEALSRAWREGDAEHIEREVVLSMRSNPGLQKTYRALLADRNIGMAARIEKYLAGNQTVFAVVGAGHLFGPEGILQLLKANQKKPGIVIERL